MPSAEACPESVLTRVKNAFTDDQLAQIKTAAFQVPHPLRGAYLHKLAELLPNDYGGGDVWRAAHIAAREVMQAPPRKSA
jgi:hypothetical protein